ncbi:uncharacterized protein SPAPADRAFT_49994 [Spathaspora passalidarum NRRL Y-27907]|uniref:Flo11 domain-containing protein n=1 Tax=Spathaspora passalidarum (strain NRRL Y-27907 / 11-Y1) TaxID=619300 RepID=G3AL27_SPAPN|nr:uncharacterized protein SPAPADRAFT_49994 [Spathaspora passalidarum NRRL Y-27907]EGW33070.1 hypothetical protein SPAPADRAFT_49994 [Spathaspora passalidarum NRRL Y-27907]
MLSIWYLFNLLLLSVFAVASSAKAERALAITYPTLTWSPEFAYETDGCPILLGWEDSCSIGDAGFRGTWEPELQTFEFKYISHVVDSVDLYEVMLEFQLDTSNLPFGYLIGIYFINILSPGGYIQYSQPALNSWLEDSESVSASPYHFFVKWVMQTESDGNQMCTTPFQIQYSWQYQSIPSSKRAIPGLVVQTANYIHDCNGDYPLQCWENVCMKQPETTTDHYETSESGKVSEPKEITQTDEGSANESEYKISTEVEQNTTTRPATGSFEEEEGAVEAISNKQEVTVTESSEQSTSKNEVELSTELDEMQSKILEADPIQDPYDPTSEFQKETTTQSKNEYMTDSGIESTTEIEDQDTTQEKNYSMIEMDYVPSTINEDKSTSEEKGDTTEEDQYTTGQEDEKTTKGQGEPSTEQEIAQSTQLEDSLSTILKEPRTDKDQPAIESTQASSTTENVVSITKAVNEPTIELDNESTKKEHSNPTAESDNPLTELEDYTSGVSDQETETEAEKERTIGKEKDYSTVEDKTTVEPESEIFLSPQPLPSTTTYESKYSDNPRSESSEREINPFSEPEERTMGVNHSNILAITISTELERENMEDPVIQPPSSPTNNVPSNSINRAEQDPKILHNEGSIGVKTEKPLVSDIQGETESLAADATYIGNSSVQSSPYLTITYNQTFTTIGVDPSDSDVSTALASTVITTSIGPSPNPSSDTPNSPVTVSTVTRPDTTYVSTVTEPLDVPVIVSTVTTLSTTVTKTYTPTVLVTTVVDVDTTYITTLTVTHNPPTLISTIINPDTTYVTTFAGSQATKGTNPDSNVPVSDDTDISSEQNDKAEEVQVENPGDNPNDSANNNYPDSGPREPSSPSRPNNTNPSNSTVNSNNPDNSPVSQEQSAVPPAQYPGGNPNNLPNSKSADGNSDIPVNSAVLPNSTPQVIVLPPTSLGSNFENTLETNADLEQYLEGMATDLKVNVCTICLWLISGIIFI